MRALAVVRCRYGAFGPGIGRVVSVNKELKDSKATFWERRCCAVTVRSSQPTPPACDLSITVLTRAVSVSGGWAQGVSLVDTSR